MDDPWKYECMICGKERDREDMCLGYLYGHDMCWEHVGEYPQEEEDGEIDKEWGGMEIDQLIQHLVESSTLPPYRVRWIIRMIVREKIDEYEQKEESPKKKE